LLGHQQQHLLGALATRGVSTTASPLHYMGHNPELALFSSASPALGLALDPMTHRRQLAAPERGKAYCAQPHGGGPAFDPDRDRLTRSERDALAIGPLELQRAHGGTLLITSHHVCGGVGTRGRGLDLELAQTGIEHFSAERIDRPPQHAAVQADRQLYVCLAVDQDVLRSTAQLLQLVDAYAQLDADGYWVKLTGFTHSGSGAAVRGGGQLLGALSEMGKPVICSGAGSLHVALLVADISSSVGLGEAETFRTPRLGERRHEGPRPRLVYHPAYGRSYRADQEPAKRAFAAARCRCGHHPPALCPVGRIIDQHNVEVRTTEAQEALAGEVTERREWLRALTALASHFAADAEVDHLRPSMIEAFLAGLDDGRQQQGDQRQAG
jgi:hypothetical protein